MKKQDMTREQLVGEAIDVIHYDFIMGEGTALEELLTFIPTEKLIGFLPVGEEQDDAQSNCKKCRTVIKNGGDWGYCTCCFEETRAEEEQDDEA